MSVVPKFYNESGASSMRIAVKKFECAGAKEPFDHPHVFLDIGDKESITCPYCATIYIYDPNESSDSDSSHINKIKGE